MTANERIELLKKCAKCEYAAKKMFSCDYYGEPITSAYYVGRRYPAREFRICKMLSLLCGEIDEPCPLPNLTEEEIEQREDEYDNED